MRVRRFFLIFGMENVILCSRNTLSNYTTIYNTVDNICKLNISTISVRRWIKYPIEYLLVWRFFGTDQKISHWHSPRLRALGTWWKWLFFCIESCCPELFCSDWSETSCPCLCLTLQSWEGCPPRSICPPWPSQTQGSCCASCFCG